MLFEGNIDLIVASSSIEIIWSENVSNVFLLIKDEENCEEPCRKRVKEEVDENNDEKDKVETSNVVRRPRVAMSRKSEGIVDIVAACPMKQTPGHTGYLTFAVLYP